MERVSQNNKVEGIGKLIELNFVYNANQEIGRVKNTIKKLPWYKEQGYSNIRLPEGLSEQSNPEEIARVISSEYLEKDYEGFTQLIKEQWFNP